MIKIKTPEEIEIMRRGGKITSEALAEVLKHVKSGVMTRELDEIVENAILSRGGTPSFKEVDDYFFSTCINVNEGIVHGIPTEYKLKDGDLLSIDLGTYFEGFHTDLSYTLEIGTNNEQKFLDTGKNALKKAIIECRVGNRIGDISFAMQSIVENAGYTVSEMLVGHGIGRDLHESPYVPCYGRKGSGHKLKVGMVFAIEVIYQKGKPDLSESSDGWTLETADKSLSGLFEKTVAITKKGPVELTGFIDG